ncbi:outer membrane channel protein TolC [Lacimicrobium alkaliphilum]|uniref:Outer membrane channel protein n=1 Tax=Lacimicrobium alkaliphilum TaxID=1526571 RepID=A0ABQ1QVJ8_9ALTE|nr:outer membrane channel protein TolC [Lacimicrobium alkaliphilum]GGD48395.1 outer membrane channel protein [Lacimicrobium alkaliphilum]
MKKSLLALLVGFSFTSQAYADDLHQVYQLALKNDPTVNKAKAQQQAAERGIAINRASLLPQISASAGYSMASSERVDFQESGIVIIESDTDTTSWGLQLDLSLYDHNNWIQMDRAEKVSRQAEVSYSNEVQDLILRTTSAYLAVLRTMDSLDFVKAEKNAIERQLEQTKQRFAVGLTAITDVHEAQANYDSTVAQQIRAENDVELRLEELRAITGKYHEELAILNTENFSPSRPSPENPRHWVKVAEEQNLELLAAKLAKDISQDDIRSARSDHLPTLSLRAKYDSSKQDVEVGGTESSLPSTDGNSIGLNLSVPIYSGGRTSAQVDQARYNYVATSEDLELAHRSTVRSVRSAYNDIIAAISTTEALKQAVVSAESALSATETGFEVGTRTIVDVLNSTRNLFSAKRDLANARYDFIISSLQLKKAVGSLTEQDLIDINQGLMAASND